MSRTAYVLSPCGQYAAVGQGARVLVWGTVHEPPLLVLKNAYVTPVSVVNWAVGGDILLARSVDGATLAWRLASGEVLFAKRLRQVYAAVVDIAGSLPPHRVATLFAGGLIQVWDLMTGAPIFATSTSRATSLWWLPDGEHLAADDGEVWHIPGAGLSPALYVLPEREEQ